MSPERDREPRRGKARRPSLLRGRAAGTPRPRPGWARLPGLGARLPAADRPHRVGCPVDRCRRPCLDETPRPQSCVDRRSQSATAAGDTATRRQPKPARPVQARTVPLALYRNVVGTSGPAPAWYDAGAQVRREGVAASVGTRFRHRQLVEVAPASTLDAASPSACFLLFVSGCGSATAAALYFLG